MYEGIAGTNKKRVFASISKSDLNAWKPNAIYTKRRASLKKWEIHRHLATNRKEEMIWYVNNPLVIGQFKICLIMSDIDCHHGESHEEAVRTADQIRDAFDYSYAERGTSGVGIHLYSLVAWDRMTTNWTIVNDIRRIEDQICSLTQNLPVCCSEVKGQPFLDDSAFSVGKYGLWAKLPHPTTPDEAEELLTRSISTLPSTMSSLVSDITRTQIRSRLSLMRMPRFYPRIYLAVKKERGRR